jgi:transcriptional regulator with XRE-family HTH domain
MVAVGSPPTVRRRHLGRELRRLREERNMLAEVLAERLRCSPSRVSRIETARIRIAPGTVHEILDILEIQGAEREQLVQLARDAEEQGWWQDYPDLPYEYATYIALESEAVSVRVFQLSIMYGLFQTEAYARAVMEQGLAGRQRSPGEVDARLRARLQRQAILTKPNAAQFQVVLDESVLHHVIGDHAVLRSQLKHLLELSQLPNVTVQVLPFSSANLLALITGPMVIMGFSDESDGLVVYLENMAGDHYVDRRDSIDTHVAQHDRLCADALSPADSQALISSLAKARRPRKRLASV